MNEIRVISDLKEKEKKRITDYKRNVQKCEHILFSFKMLSQISLTFMQSKCLPFSTAKLALHKIYEKISRNFFINYMEHIHLHISQNFDLKMHNGGKKFLCYQLCIQGVPFEKKSEINCLITKTAHI